MKLLHVLFPFLKKEVVPALPETPKVYRYGYFLLTSKGQINGFLHHDTLAEAEHSRSVTRYYSKTTDVVAVEVKTEIKEKV